MAIFRPLSLLFSIVFCNSFYAQDTLIHFNSEWKYYDEEAEPLDDGMWEWIDTTYNDNMWSCGIGQLGYGESDQATTLNSNSLTCYFRKNFEISNTSLYSHLDLNLLYDDGAVVYLNGNEIWSVNMPSPPFTYNTFASSASSDNSRAYNFRVNDLVKGSNTIAIEVHQRSINSSDISFDFELIGIPLDLIRVRRGPYLQQGAKNRAIVKWRTDKPTSSKLEYGVNINDLNMSSTDAHDTTDHEIVLVGLQPNTKYYYQIGNGSDTLIFSNVDLFFLTAPENDSKTLIRAWVLGDAGTGNNNQRSVRDAYYDYVQNETTDMILFLGDNAYNDGKDDEYQYSLFQNMYEDKLKNTFCWSTLGNHDGHSADSQSQTGPYFDIFTLPGGGECGGLASGTEAYYSFDYGNVHFIVLDSYDSDRSVGSTMYNWCQNDIQDATEDWIVAFWHHPPYSKGSHDSDSSSYLIQMRQNFLPMLESNGIDLVLAGHSHSYERSYFINGHFGSSASYDSDVHPVGVRGNGSGRISETGAYQRNASGLNANKGTVYITTGSAGKTSSGSLDHSAMFYSVKALGSCILEIEADTLNLKFLRETGAIEDHFTIIKYDCPSADSLIGNVVGDTMLYAHNIFSNATLSSVNNVIFKGGNEICLDSNFNVQTGVNFEALIDDCPE